MLTLVQALVQECVVKVMDGMLDTKSVFSSSAMHVQC